MTVVTLQYLTPLIFTLYCTLLLKSLGEGLGLTVCGAGRRRSFGQGRHYWRRGRRGA